MPKYLKVILIVAAALAVVLAAAGIALKMYFTPQRLRALIMPQIEKTVGRQVKVESFSLKMWTGLGVEVKGIELANAQGFDQRPMARIRSVVLKVNLLALLQRQLAITSLVIDRPEILIEKNVTGTFNFADLIKPPPPPAAGAPAPAAPASAPVAIALSSFRVNEGAFEFDDRQGRIKAVATGINQSLSLDADRKMENIHTTGKITVGRVDVILPAMSVTKLFATVDHDISVNLPGKKVTITGLTVAPLGIALTLAGTIGQFDSLPQLDLALKTTAIDMQQVFAAVPPEFRAQVKDIQASGRLELGLKVTGQIDPQDPKSKPKIDGLVGLRAISVKHVLLPKSVSDINGDIRFSENDLDVKSISAKMGSAGFQLSCLVKNFEDPSVKVAFKGNFDLGEVKDFVPLEQGTTLAGKIDADFRAEGRVKEVNSFTMDGKVDLKAIGLSTKALLKPVTDLSGTVQLTKNLINVPDISCKIGRSSLSFQAQVKNFLSLVPEQPAPKGGKPAMALPKSARADKASVTFALTSPLLDLDEMLPPPPAAAGKSQNQNAKSQTAQPQMMPLPDMLADGKVRIAKIKFLKMDFDNLAGNLSLADRKLNLDGQVNVYSGKVLGGVWADLNDLTKIGYRLDANASQLEVNDFLTALTPFKDRLFATTDMKAEFSGLAPDSVLIKQSLKGNGTVRAGDGKLINWPLLADILTYTKISDRKEIAFSSLAMGFRILDQKIYLDDLQMASKFGDVTVSGSSSFTGFLDYRATIKLTKDESDQLKGRTNATAAGLFTDKDGRVTIDLLVKGQAPKPSIGYDTQMLQARLKGKAQEEIDRLKSEGEAKVKAETDKLKKEAEEKARKEAEELKNKAKGALKGLFGG